MIPELFVEKIRFGFLPGLKGLDWSFLAEGPLRDKLVLKVSIPEQNHFQIST